MVTGDLFNVEGRIKTIDKNLSLRYEGQGNYTILHKGMYFMSAKHNELNGELVDKVRQVVWMNKHRDILADIERDNKKIEEGRQKEYDYIKKCAVEDMYPYINKDV